jgi:hypothetical protein
MTTSCSTSNTKLTASSENGGANWEFAWFSRKIALKESMQTASLPYTRAAIFILSGRRNTA